MNRGSKNLYIMGRWLEAPWGGVKRYIEELVPTLLEEKQEQWNIVILHKNERMVGHFDREGIIDCVVSSEKDIIWDHYHVPKYIASLSDENGVLFNPTTITPLFINIPVIVTFHDLMYFPQPKKYSWSEYRFPYNIYYCLMAKYSVRRSKAIICVSEATKNDAKTLLLSNDLLSPNLEKIHVVHHGVSKKYSGNSNSMLSNITVNNINVTSPYIFCPSSLSIRKNVSLLINAFSLIYEGTTCNLVITGGFKAISKDMQINDALKKIPSNRVAMLGFVTENDLKILYQNAAFCVFPSRYEGFGLPLLEAMQAGTAVICSDIAPHREVAGDAALFFKNNSVSSLSGKLLEMTRDTRMLNTFASRGLARVEKFTWQRAAKKFWKIADCIYDKSRK